MIDRASFVHVCLTDFHAFAQAAFEVLNPGEQFLDNWHIDAIAHALEEMRLGTRRRQVINLPPRMLKSMLVSVCWPAFLLGHDPATKIIAVSYGEQLAEQLSNDTRRLMQSPFYQEIFPRTVLTRQTSLHLATAENGCRYATTVGGSVTGFGAGWILVDDAHNTSDADSLAAREKAIAYFKNTLSSRFNNPTDGRIIVVAQRVHEHDLSGHLLGQSDWRHLKLQARAAEDAEIPIGPGRLHRVAAGDLLQPDRLPAHWLDEQRSNMGSAAFSAQYQQEPLPAEGNIIQKKWLQYCDPPPRHVGRIVLSVDTATKDNTEADYSACTVWQQVDKKHHLIHVWEDKVNFPTLRRKILDMVALFQPHAILIEDAGSGSALIQDLRAGGVPATARKAKDSKVVRLSSASSYIESGHMWLPTDAAWLARLEVQLLGFPGTRHDDLVDTLSQYFNWIRETPTPIFEWDWLYDEPGSVDHDSIASLLARY